MVEEANIHTVSVVSCADWGDGHESISSLAPQGTSHGPRIVDDEEGVEGAQERVGIISDRC